MPRERNCGAYFLDSKYWLEPKSDILPGMKELQRSVALAYSLLESLKTAQMLRIFISFRLKDLIGLFFLFDIVQKNSEFHHSLLRINSFVKRETIFNFEQNSLYFISFDWPK